MLQPLAKGVDLDAIGFYWFTTGKVAGVDCIIARTGYTGEDGFELATSIEAGRALWGRLIDSGVEPCGLGARDTLRLEAKLCLYGTDIDATTTPLEAGLGWVVKLDKGDFIWRAALQKQKEAGLSRKLVGFTLTESGIARHGYPVVQDGKRVGVVTSGTKSPSTGASVGLAYVPPGLAAEGSTLSVEIRGKAVAAKVVKTPFYSKKK